MATTRFGFHLDMPAKIALGSVEERTNIRSPLGLFPILPGYRIAYPAAVIRALAGLYDEYNRVFASLIGKNREWPSDYQYCLGQDGALVNFAVQIDMVGLPQAFLDAAVHMSPADLREVLRGTIFEIENSLAMYQLLERLFSRNGLDSFFNTRFRAALAELRKRFGMPIALLAVTDEKYRAMREVEFGGQGGESLSDSEVLELSGFDRFFGPEEFRRHIEENGGVCRYLLYARTSDPVAKLKNPELQVEHPLLGDPETRRVIKAYTLTFNVDDPQWSLGDERRINDTKGYMAPMRMAFPIAGEQDLLSAAFSAHLAKKKASDEYSGERLTIDFAAYLLAQGIDPHAVAIGGVSFRCKPAQGAYGCYGHVSGHITDREFRSELRRNMRKRGPYVVQPEMQTPRLTNATDGTTHTFIDRNFFGMVDGHPEFLGGFRVLIPWDSTEAQNGRIHGNRSAIHAEIVA